MEVQNLLFVEYTCMQEETKFGIWSDANYFAFITSGKKMWKTILNDYEANKGDILFIKKGANLTHQFFGETFCAIFFFIPDDFIQTFLQKYPNFLSATQKDISKQDAVLRVESDQILENYCHSIVHYLSLSTPPTETLIKHKVEELLINLCANSKHEHLKDYFHSICQDETYHLTRVMEENYAYNLKITDFAKLCHMSLSKFKKVFKEHYETTPAAWLKKRKLDLARHRLLTTEWHINQLSLECGFEDTSHFIRVFKQYYGLTPLQYRQQQNIMTD